MEPDTHKCTDCTFKSKAAALLNREELNLLNQHCLIQSVKRGEKVLREGEPACYVVYLREGFIKQSKKDSSGKEHLLDIVKKGSYVGLHNILPGCRNNQITATSIKESQVCLIDTESFTKLLKSNGEFATRVLSCVSENELFFVKRLMNNLEKNLTGRLAEALIYFRSTIYNENPFHLDITRDELASFIGASRESVSRALGDLHNEGIIRVENQSITKKKKKKLQLLGNKG